MDPRHPNYQQDVEREPMEFDVLIVGAGPAGLSAAIRLRQLADERGEDLSVCVIEKGSEVGAHILSGAVMDPRAINELIPDWKDKGAPLNTPVTKDEFLFLTEKKAHKSPILPPQMQNHGNYIVSLGNVCRWLGEQAEAAGAEVFAGFPGAQVLYNDDGSVAGVATGDMGLDAEGKPGPNYEPGVELRARMTLFGEGCRGSLTKEIMEKFDLRKDSDPQTYGIGIKELWEVDPAKHEQGKVVHTAGWPLDNDTYGGSFIYHLEDNQVAIGFIVGLDYKNPHLSPFDEMQRHKLHPAVKPLFEGGRRISYGARALVEGGIQALPKLGAPGALLIGDSAGFLNVPRIKGSHNAIKTGMLAAESAYDTLTGGANDATDAYEKAVRGSWVWDELSRARNVRPAFAKWGLWGGTLYTGIDTLLFRGKAPWTLRISHSRQRNPDSEGPGPEDRLPQTGRQDHLRQTLVGVPVQHQPRRKPARPPAPARRVHPRGLQPRPVRRPRTALLPGRRLRNRPRRRRLQPPAADQRPELRPLQNLRHQGPEAEHQLGNAGRRRRAELPEYVTSHRAGRLATALPERCPVLQPSLWVGCLRIANLDRSQAMCKETPKTHESLTRV